MSEDKRRILLPIDFCSDSQAALEYAVGLACEHLSEIVLLHVVEPLPRGTSPWCDSAELLEERARAARRQLEYCEKRAIALYPHCRSELRFGTAAQAIAELASNLEADLIVVSVRRRTGILDRLLEGLPEKLMRLAPCPVLAVQIDNPPLQAASGSRKRPSTLSSLNIP